ncbi:MAG: hypothetical protein KDK25_04780 [Leptospiraceae bacterium]|nr:hypothetical protein [Leptospiraceae bacterium]
MNRWAFRNSVFFLVFIAIFFSSYAMIRAERFGGLSSLIGFGCLHDSVCFGSLNSHVLPKGAAIFPTGGYDGQFYYYVAAGLYGHQDILDLSSALREEPGPGRIFVDSLGFRLPRIGFPLLSGWLFLFGARALALGMPLLLLLSHLLSSWFLFRMRPSAGWLYGLNPVSLLSYGLNLAEPLAMSLAVSASIALIRPAGLPGSMRNAFRWWSSILALLLALISKETMFVVGFALGWFFLLFAWKRTVAMANRIKQVMGPTGAVHSAGAEGQKDRTGAVAGLYAMASYWALPVWILISGLLALLWYYHAGFFSGESAAGKMQLPFTGLLDFLQSGNGLSGGRGLLALGIFWMAFLSLYFVLHSILPMRTDVFSRSDRDRKKRAAGIGRRTGTTLLERRLVFPGLALNLLLISFASAEEYWLTFANIVRLFAPAFLLMSFLRQRWLFRVSAGWTILISFLLWWNDFRHLM